MNSTREKNINKNEGGYGLLSMIGMIIGIVIGSGIFIKNQALIEGTHSALLSTIGWILGGLIVLSMMLSFIEISSITKIKDQQGTFKNWSYHLWGNNVSKIIGTYFTLFYFPLVLSAETIFASNQLMQLGEFGTTTSHPTNLWLIISILTIVILLFAFFITSNYVKPGKAVSSTGSIIKLIPLFVVVFSAILLLIGIDFGKMDHNDINQVFNPDDAVNSGLETNKSNFACILAILPSILFAFDGFLYANSMSGETKSKNTFRNAVIISVVFITLIYILFSLSSYMLAEPGEASNFTITNILLRIFEPWMADLLVIIIFLSIVTATFAYATTSMWSLADYSYFDNVSDKNGDFIKRNKVGNPKEAGLAMLKYTLIAMAVLRLLDLITIETLNAKELWIADEVSATVMTDYVSDLFTICNFGFYALIIIGGVKNRFTKEHEVEKVGGFFIFAFFSSIVMIGVVGYMIFDTIHSIINPFVSNTSLTTDSIVSVYKIVTLLIFLGAFLAIFIINENSLKKLDGIVSKEKTISKRAYHGHVYASLFQKEIESGNFEKAEKIVNENYNDHFQEEVVKKHKKRKNEDCIDNLLKENESLKEEAAKEKLKEISEDQQKKDSKDTKK